MGKKIEHGHAQTTGQPSSPESVVPAPPADQSPTSTRRGKLTSGQQALLDNFKTHLAYSRDFELEVQQANGDDMSDLPEDMIGFAREVAAENRATLRRAREHGFAMYLDLAADPRTKKKADKALAKDRKKRKKLGIPSVSVAPKPVTLDTSIATVFGKDTWDIELDPDAPRRDIPTDDEPTDDQ